MSSNEPDYSERKRDPTLSDMVTLMVTSLDRRFESLHRDLKELINQRFADSDLRWTQKFEDSDLRYQQRFDQSEKALEAALAAAKEAVTTALTATEKANIKSEMASDKRFESVNEFRGQLADQAASLMPRSEAESRWLAINEKIDDLREFRSGQLGRASASPTVSSQIADLSVEVAKLRDFKASTGGERGGTDRTVSYIIGIVGFAATVISVVVVIVNLATR